MSEDNTKIVMENVNVGMFSLPGLVIKNVDQEKIKEIEHWCLENSCGTKMTDSLWSFRNEKQREWFILRWS